ncbi:hypothetical protein [Campylobacter sp. RM9328]|nr:hypothetical protein [Campylobacter sp. RM9328]
MALSIFRCARSLRLLMAICYVVMSKCVIIKRLERGKIIRERL